MFYKIHVAVLLIAALVGVSITSGFHYEGKLCTQTVLTTAASG